MPRPAAPSPPPIARTVLHDPRSARRLSLALFVVGALAASFWTFASSFIAGYNEDDECIYRAGGCDDTSQFIGLALPVWIAMGLVVAALLCAWAKWARISRLLVVSSIAPLYIVRIPHTDYFVNQLLTGIWLSIIVVTGVLVSLRSRSNAST
jgi:hypothetical protein